MAVMTQDGLNADEAGVLGMSRQISLSGFATTMNWSASTSLCS